MLEFRIPKKRRNQTFEREYNTDNYRHSDNATFSVTICPIDRRTTNRGTRKRMEKSFWLSNTINTFNS
jgi:hypothetical protein